MKRLPFIKSEVRRHHRVLKQIKVYNYKALTIIRPPNNVCDAGVLKSSKQISDEFV
jgi:hypothetical protein